MNEVQFYCCDHNSVFCGLCKTAKHLTCDSKRISEICNSTTYFQSTLDQTVQDIKTMKKEYEKLKSSDIEKIDSIRAVTQSCRLQLKSMRQQMEMFFDTIEKEIDCEETRDDRSVEDLRENIATYTDVVNHLSSLHDHIDQVTKSSDKVAHFAAQAKLKKLHAEYCIVKETVHFNEEKKIAQKLHMTITEVQKECDRICKISNEPKKVETKKEQTEIKEVKRTMEKMTEQVQEIGSSQREPDCLNMHSTQTLDSDGTNSNTSQIPGKTVEKLNLKPSFTDDKVKGHIKPVKAIVEKSNSSSKLKVFANMKIKKKYLVSIKTDDTTTSNITSSLFLPDRSLILCDNANSNILILDKDFSLCDKLHTGGSPWDMALTTANEIAVTITEQNGLKYITKDSGKLHEGASIHFKRTAWGISAYKGYLIISFHDNPGKGAIEIRTKKGEIIRQIYLKEHGREVLVAPFYLSVNQANGNIVVTDGEKQHLICSNFEGEVLKKFKHDDLKWAKKVILDEKGDCLVCASFANKLKLVKDNLQSTQDLWQNSDILEKWLNQCRSPQTVSMRWNDLTMIVAHETKNQIQVFKLIK